VSPSAAARLSHLASIGCVFHPSFWEMLSRLPWPASLFFICLSLSAPAVATSNEPSLRDTNQGLPRHQPGNSVLEVMKKCSSYAAWRALDFFEPIINLVKERPLFTGITALHLLIPCILLFRHSRALKKQLQEKSEVSDPTALGKEYYLAALSIR